MPKAPEPVYTAILNVGYSSTLHIFKFTTIEDALSVKKNLLIAIDANAYSFDIEVDAIDSTMLNLKQIQSLIVIDLITDRDSLLRNIPYEKYVENLFEEARKDAEDMLDETAFGIR